MHSVSVLSKKKKKKKKKKKNEFKNSLPVASIELLLTGARTTFSDADYGLIETSGDLGVGIENQPSFSSSSFFFKGLTRLRARATERERERSKSEELRGK
jgi:hypothetical protein